MFFHNFLIIFYLFTQDLALEFDFENFKWRWDTYLLGPKTSAELISKHLIFPFISLTHISFNSADSVSELDGADLEKVINYDWLWTC